MCHSLFTHLYETRLLFVKVLRDEFIATVSNQSMADLSPFTVNHLFHQCVSKKQPFQEFGSQYAKEYARSLSASVDY